jgi:hypothetical protein
MKAMMRILFAGVLASLLQGAHADDPIVLSVSFRENPVQLSKSAILLISLTNQSNTPRYIPREVGPRLEFAVSDPDGRLVRGFDDIPPPPPLPKDARDLVRVQAKQSLHCFVEMPLSDLGIRAPGTYSVMGGWHGLALLTPEIDVNRLAFASSHAEAVKLTVTAIKAPANVGLQPTAQPSDAKLAPCAEAEAGR